MVLMSRKIPRRRRGRLHNQETQWRRQLQAATEHCDPAQAVLLGVDPSINTCGLAVFRDGTFDDCRILKTKGIAVEERLDDLFVGFGDVLREVRPDLVVLEGPNEWTRTQGPGRAKAVNTGDLMKLASACGVIRAACVAASTPCLTVTVSRWKGSQRKQTTAVRLQLLTGVSAENHHAADAAALGLWLLEEHRYARVINA